MEPVRKELPVASQFRLRLTLAIRGNPRIQEGERAQAREMLTTIAGRSGELDALRLAGSVASLNGLKIAQGHALATERKAQAPRSLQMVRPLQEPPEGGNGTASGKSNGEAAASAGRSDPSQLSEFEQQVQMVLNRRGYITEPLQQRYALTLCVEIANISNNATALDVLGSVESIRGLEQRKKAIRSVREAARINKDFTGGTGQDKEPGDGLAIPAEFEREARALIEQKEGWSDEGTRTEAVRIAWEIARVASKNDALQALKTATRLGDLEWFWGVARREAHRRSTLESVVEQPVDPDFERRARAIIDSGGYLEKEWERKAAVRLAARIAALQDVEFAFATLERIHSVPGLKSVLGRLERGGNIRTVEGSAADPEQAAYGISSRFYNQIMKLLRKGGILPSDYPQAIRIAGEIARLRNERVALYSLRKSRTLHELQTARANVLADGSTAGKKPAGEVPSASGDALPPHLRAGIPTTPSLQEDTAHILLRPKRLAAVQALVERLPQYDADEKLDAKRALLTALERYEGDENKQRKAVALAVSASSVAEFQLRLNRMILEDAGSLAFGEDADNPTGSDRMVPEEQDAGEAGASVGWVQHENRFLKVALQLGTMEIDDLADRDRAMREEVARRLHLIQERAIDAREAATHILLLRKRFGVGGPIRDTIELATEYGCTQGGMRERIDHAMEFAAGIARKINFDLPEEEKKRPRTAIGATERKRLMDELHLKPEDLQPGQPAAAANPWRVVVADTHGYRNKVWMRNLLRQPENAEILGQLQQADPVGHRLIELCFGVGRETRMRRYAQIAKILFQEGLLPRVYTGAGLSVRQREAQGFLVRAIRQRQIGGGM